jgi:protein TonB
MLYKIVFSAAIVIVVFTNAQNASLLQGPSITDTAAAETKPDSNEVYMFADTMPIFQADGYASYTEYISANLRYPEEEKRKEGFVYVSCIVEIDGSITAVRITKSVEGAPGFSKEAIRIISTMPKWKPGVMDGHPVRVKMMLPVRFEKNGWKKQQKQK